MHTSCTWHAGYLAPAPDATPFGKDAALLGRPIMSYTVSPCHAADDVSTVPTSFVALQHPRTARGTTAAARTTMSSGSAASEPFLAQLRPGLSWHTPLSVLQGHASLRDNMRLQRLVQQLGFLVTSGSSLPAAGHAAFGGGDLDTDAGAEVLSGLHSQVLQMGDAIFLELAQQVTVLLCCSACLCQASGMGLCCMACLPTANRTQGCRFEQPARHCSRHKTGLTWPVPYVLLTSHSSTGMPLAALQSLRVDRALALQQLWASLRLYMAKLAHLDEADAENSIAVATAPIPVEQQVPGALSKPVCALLSKMRVGLLDAC